MMVCLGNICRSPIAHGILQDRIDKYNLPWLVDSSGTSSWHVGEAPHAKSISVAKEKNINISNQRSQLFTSNMLDVYDFILVMDSNNYTDVIRMATNEAQKSKVKLLMNFAPNESKQVPDPFYEGGFEAVYDMIEKAVDGFVKANNNKTIEAYLINVKGKVQGVGFRHYTKREADKLKLLGTIRNEPDGSVNIVVVGAQPDLKTFLDWCHNGPPTANVDTIDFKKVPAGDFDNFEILR